MAALEETVLTAFFERLTADDGVSDAVVVELRALFADGALPKPAAVLKLIVEATEDGLT